MNSQMVVATKMRMIRVDGAYVKENARVLRADMKVLRTHVEETNAESKNNGVYFVMDEEKTKLFCEQQKENQAKKEQKAKLSNISANDLVSALTDAVQGKTKESKKEVELPYGEPNEDWTKEQLQKYCYENSIEYKKTQSEKTLLDLITKK